MSEQSMAYLEKIWPQMSCRGTVKRLPSAGPIRMRMALEVPDTPSRGCQVVVVDDGLGPLNEDQTEAVADGWRKKDRAASR